MDLSLNGFTVLPANFQKRLGRRTYNLEARWGGRRSSSVSVGRFITKEEETPPITLHARVFKDRGAYRPGDTLKAKAVLFEGDLRDRVKTLPAGKDVQVWIFNAEREKVADIDLKTNSFGSVGLGFPHSCRGTERPLGHRSGLSGTIACPLFFPGR
jgi:MG2 domain.